MSEFKNENLNVKIEKLPGCNIKLEIAVSPKATEAAYAKALKNINKEIVVPGFRKGKAPANVVLEKFKNQINEEWRSVLLNTAFQEALELVKIYPIFQNSIKPEIKSICKENGAELTFSYEARPDIPNINPSEITLKNVAVDPVTQKEIDERVYELQLNQATWNDIEGRGIEDGDFVALDIESLDNPGVVLCKEQTFRVAKDQIGGWLYRLLLGKTSNEVFEGLSEKDACQQCDDHTHVHQEEPEFKPSKVQITVKSIKTPVLPEIDVEFAKKLGAESVELLHERVVSSLEKNAKDRAQQQLRDQIQKNILEKYQFDIPRSILNEDARGLSDEDLKPIIDSYRMYFLAQKLGNELNLQVTQDEIMEEFMIQAYMKSREESLIQENDDPKEIQHRLQSYLLDRKVKDYLIQHANKE